jgi:hypothetical protein
MEPGVTMRTIGISLIATLLATEAVSAQVRADPGVEIGNRIAVRVNVTLADEETPYSPARDVALAFARAGADTVVARTDEAGVITVLLPKGDYIVSTRQPYQWKGSWFTWSVPISVRTDMPTVELNRANARVDGHGARGDKNTAGGQVQNTAAASAPAPQSTDVRSENDALPWLSIEAGGEGGLTRIDSENGSDAGFGGSASFVGGLGPVALALGYRYTSVRYGKDVDNGTMRSGTLELRYHFRPGASPVRPYIGAVASLGQWDDPTSLTDEHSDIHMFGGTAGVQFGLATSVRLHLAATVAGTRIKDPADESSSGLFATMNLGLTFDIFSPAR